MDELWNFFDDVRCINLYEREDRYEEFRTEALKLKIPVKFYRTNRHPTNGMLGCYESHMNCIQEAIDNKQDNLLIFEDDAIPNKNLTEETLAECVRFMMENNKWTIFYLGCVPNIFRYTKTAEIVPGYKDIYKVRASHTHAYVINKRYMREMVSIPFKGEGPDYNVLDAPEVYAHLPSLFEQSTSNSDARAARMGKIRVLWCKFHEWYAINNMPPPYNFAIVIIILVILVVMWIAYQKI